MQTHKKKSEKKTVKSSVLRWKKILNTTKSTKKNPQFESPR